MMVDTKFGIFGLCQQLMKGRLLKVKIDLLFVEILFFLSDNFLKDRAYYSHR